MIRRILLGLFLLLPMWLSGQINTERVMTIARNALYFEDYVLSIQYFNQVINAKPYLSEPYFYRGLAKLNLDDYQGAEEDCTEAIQRNPFMISAYQVRGLVRIRLKNYSGAVADYKKALEYDPENICIWHNLAMCEIQQEDYAQAEEALKSLLTISPKYTTAYLMQGEVALKQQDTVKAMRNFDRAIELDKYDADAWSLRAMLKLQQSEYKEAEEDLDKAIHLASKNAGNYINRALARFHQNNLRGAMSDYDKALDVDPHNLIGYYNRGLLRGQVGDDNRAIEDFDKVIAMEPDNMMALFNRGLLRSQTGDYKGAIRDFSAVIEEYPNFLTGYHYRAQARRKIGDNKGADADEYKLLKAEIDSRNGGASAQNTASNRTEEKEKTRKQSNKNMDNYGKIVVADNSEAEQKYKNEYRGKVQDRNVAIELEPMFALTYYEKKNEMKRSVHYYKYIDDLNREHILPENLLITNQESALSEMQVKNHFASIDERSSEIVTQPENAKIRFARALDFYLVQDFSSAMDDLTQAILFDNSFFPAYFMRSLVRYKELEYQKAQAEMDQFGGGTVNPQTEIKAIDYDIVKRDLDKVIELAPDFAYAYYNRGNILSMLKDYRSAIADYNKAIELDANLAEAYYNRGLTHIFLGNNRQGISDLSKAGELGIVSAYNVIKRFTESKE